MLCTFPPLSWKISWFTHFGVSSKNHFQLKADESRHSSRICKKKRESLSFSFFFFFRANGKFDFVEVEGVNFFFLRTQFFKNKKRATHTNPKMQPPDAGTLLWVQPDGGWWWPAVVLSPLDVSHFGLDPSVSYIQFLSHVGGDAYAAQIELEDRTRWSLFESQSPSHEEKLIHGRSGSVELQAAIAIAVTFVGTGMQPEEETGINMDSEEVVSPLPNDDTRNEVLEEVAENLMRKQKKMEQKEKRKMEKMEKQKSKKETKRERSEDESIEENTRGHRQKHKIRRPSDGTTQLTIEETQTRHQKQRIEAIRSTKHNITTEELCLLSYQLQQCISHHDMDEMKKILSKLATVNVTLEQLQESHIGCAVGLLLAPEYYTNGVVTTLVDGILSYWLKSQSEEAQMQLVNSLQM